MFNQAICGEDLPVRLSFDHDPLFQFQRWQANLRILGVEAVQTVPLVPCSHPFVERLIGSLRREYLDHLFYWNAGVSLPEIPSAWDLLSFQQVGDRLLTKDDLVGQQSPGTLDLGTTVSFRSGI
jgi:hypothetical protein